MSVIHDKAKPDQKLELVAKPPPPTLQASLSEVDRLRLEISNERELRLQMQAEALRIQMTATVADLNRVRADGAARLSEIRLRYSIGEADILDIQTGAITRQAAQPTTGQS